jgi:ketopantoate reductase
MKIAILGSGSIGLNAALIVALGSKYEITVIDSVDDINPCNTDILICDDDSIKLVQPINVPDIYMACAIDVPCRDNSFRGGSRGKGGKIKYARR